MVQVCELLICGVSGTIVTRLGQVSDSIRATLGNTSWTLASYHTGDCRADVVVASSRHCHVLRKLILAARHHPSINQQPAGAMCLLSAGFRASGIGPLCLTSFEGPRISLALASLGKVLSGKVLIVLLVGFCVAMAGFATLRQSQTTSRIRQLWGAEAASVIQNADTITWFVPDDPNQPIDLSNAAGVVHLKATLVDDVYLQSRDAGEVDWSLIPRSAMHRIEFQRQTASVWVQIETDSGQIYCEQTQRSATLIPASRDAVRHYLGTLQTEVAGGPR